MKKLLATTLATLVVLALAAGCSSKEDSATPVVSTTETTVPTQLPTQPPAATTSSTQPPAATTSSTQPPATTAAPPAATPSGSFPASGTTKSSTVTESQEVVGDKLVIKEAGSHDYHGTLEGKLTIKFTVELSMVDGTFTLTGDGIFTGSVNGREGTLTTRHNATGRVSADGNGTIRDEVSIVSGTGRLSDLHGTLVVEGTTGETAEGTYSGTLSFGTEALPSTTSAGAGANGTLEMTDQVNDSPWVTENGIMSANLTSTFEYHGDLEGTLVEKGLTKVDMATGKITGDTIGTFTGTVEGKQGTFTASGSWASQFLSPTNGSGGCTYTILSGTGELDGLSGTITVKTTAADGSTTGTYTHALTFK
jgi:hypothetical protein